MSKRILMVAMMVVMMGCESGSFPARSACRMAARAVTLACEYVPDSVGGESPPVEGVTTGE